MKNFKIEKSEKNLNWINNNLDARDFKIEENEIVISYFNEGQKTDILTALDNLVVKTYDVVFHDDMNSNCKGFETTINECKTYIATYNGTNESYFADYKGGIVQVVCHQTEEVVYEESIK